MASLTATTLALTLGIVVAQQGAPRAQEQAEPGAPVMGAAEIAATTGAIQQIDKEKRTIVLKDSGGDMIRIQVPPELPNFDQLEKGQKVELTYYDSIAVAFLPPGAARPSAETRVHVEPAQQGGMVGREITVSAEIASVDTRNKKVELKLPSGQTQTVAIADSDLQKRLGELKPGQLATVTYTEAVAASVAPAAGKGTAR